MKKKFKSGFTLTEAVITMTIIGVVSALLLPMANKFRPDPLKVKYLQTYDAITYVASQLANDSAKFGLFEHFEMNGYNKNISLDKVPFFNRPKEFCDNFIIGVNAPAGTSCSEPAADTNDKYSTAEFETSNGIRWNIQAHSNYNGRNILNTEFSAIITATIEEQIFNFVIGADGQTYIADSQGLAYASTRSSWKNASYDLAKYEASIENLRAKANEELIAGLGKEWDKLYYRPQNKKDPNEPEDTNTVIPEDTHDPDTPIYNDNTVDIKTGDGNSDCGYKNGVYICTGANTNPKSPGGGNPSQTTEDFDADGDGLNENDELGNNPTHVELTNHSSGVTHQSLKTYD